MHVAQKKLTKKEENELFNNLFLILKNFHKKSKTAIFCRNFFTQTELLTFAKRLNIMILLEQGMGYKEIKEKIKVSSASIATVSKLLKSQNLKLIFDTHKGRGIALKQTLWNFFFT